MKIVLDLRKVIDDPCFSNPCLNGGTCTQVGDSYSCACTEEYQGTNCDRLITSTTTSTSTTTATSGTTEDREGPTGAPQPPFANISVQDFFGQSCELRFRIIHWMDKLNEFQWGRKENDGRLDWKLSKMGNSIRWLSRDIQKVEKRWMLIICSPASLILVTSGCWWLYVGDNFWVLVKEFHIGDIFRMLVPDANAKG